MRRIVLQALTVLGAILLAGCAGWRRANLSTTAPIPPRQQVQVWQAGRSQLVHAVVVRGDTLYAVPFTQSPSCDSCGVAIPLNQVDSTRLGNLERAGFLAVFVPIVALVGLTVAFALGYGSD